MDGVVIPPRPDLLELPLLCGLECREVGLLDLDLFPTLVGVDPDDDLLPPLDCKLVLVGRALDLLLEVWDRSRCAPEFIDPCEVLEGQLFDGSGQGLDGIAPCEWNDRLGDPGLMGQDLLCPEG